MRRKKNASLPEKRKGYRIKETYFSEKAKDNDDFNGVVGLIYPDDKVIYIEKSLPSSNNGSKRLTLNHELAHARLDKIELEKRIGIDKTEKFVELEAIVRTPRKYLTHAETILKRFLTGDSTLTIKDDFSDIVRNMLFVLNIKCDRALLKELVTGVPRKVKK